jgi:hypothetical protein
MHLSQNQREHHRGGAVPVLPGSFRCAQSLLTCSGCSLEAQSLSLNWLSLLPSSEVAWAPSATVAALAEG